MAILFSQADGSDQHYDTYEEFEKALILLKRLNGEKVPQDLLDEVREKYYGKEPKTSQVEIDGPQDLEALGKAGDIVIATEDEFDITEGYEYEILEDGDGDLYFLDDIGDIRYVLNHKRRLRKKPTERGFKKGDIVFVNDEFTDHKGETSRRGYARLTGVGSNGELYLTYGLFVKGNRSYIEGNEDKITLVCRAEDRLDK